MNNNENLMNRDEALAVLAALRGTTVDEQAARYPVVDEHLPDGLSDDDMGPEPRDDNDENSWEDDESARIHEDDMERDDTPFLTEDNLWEDQHDTGDW
jgi:hypothetical protein